MSVSILLFSYIYIHAYGFKKLDQLNYPGHSQLPKKIDPVNINDPAIDPNDRSGCLTWIIALNAFKMDFEAF
jgi:hypothetical protein